MHALTVLQPWAWAIAHAGKDIENRTWRPPASLIGQRIAIHAGMTIVHEDFSDCFDLAGRVPAVGEMALGVVVAVATIVGVTEGEGASSLWAFGPVCWHLGDVVALPRPVPCRGWQGLWTLRGRPLQEVVAQLGGSA